MREEDIKKNIIQKFNDFNQLNQHPSTLKGIIFFGSRIKYPNHEIPEDSDYDIGIIYSGAKPDIEFPENWDVFLWTVQKWKRGFALQIELASYAKILMDEEKIIENQFQMIREKILPHWGGYIKKF